MQQEVDTVHELDQPIVGSHRLAQGLTATRDNRRGRTPALRQLVALPRPSFGLVASMEEFNPIYEVWQTFETGMDNPSHIF